jgi:putative oxidoreductase
MWKALIRTTNDPAATAMRVALGLVILPHGLQKSLGWFGGPGFGATLGFFDQALGVSAPLTALVVLAEVAGGVGLIVGFLSRVAAASIALVMVGAVSLVHGQFGFFMNWSGTAAGEGFEYHILASVLALAVMIRGSGALSVDCALARRLGELAPAERREVGRHERPSRVA